MATEVPACWAPHNTVVICGSWRRSFALINVQMVAGHSRCDEPSRAGAGKTLEVRRGEAADARGRTPSPADIERLFLGSVLDRHRPRVALPPFPKAAPPPAKPSEQRQQVSLCATLAYQCSWRCLCLM